MAKDKELYRIFEHINDVDISEQDIWDYEPDVLNKLLIDHTMSAKARRESNDQTKVVNIFWAKQSCHYASCVEGQATSSRPH